MKTNEFIIRAKKVHKNKYDYSLVDYVNNHTKVKIICNIHGIFEQQPTHHVNRKQNCPSCTGHKTNTNLFIKKAKLIHGNKYDYTKVNYISAKKNIIILCPLHGEFTQTPNNHLKGKECFYCTGTPKKSTDDFINKATIRHNKKYNYSLVNYLSRNDKIKIICPTHGIFNQTPAAHLKGQGCPICRESKGEKLINNFLTDRQIEFKPQHRFPDCRYKLPLPFDFYLPKHNICIEYQGHQHFSPLHNFGSKSNEFGKIQLRDKIKLDYCLNNKILLLLISYNENILDILNNFFSSDILKTTA